MRVVEIDCWDWSLVQENSKAKNWGGGNFLLIQHDAADEARKKVFVLVHGADGHPIKDWATFMPHAFNTFFCDVDIAVYKYRNPPKIRTFMSGLKKTLARPEQECFVNQLQDLQDRGYTNIVLLGHSFGGIFLRKVLQYLITHRHQDSYSALLENIRSLFYFATPFAGSHSFLLGLMSMIKKDAKILCTFNDELDELNGWWREYVTHSPSLPGESHKVLLQEWGLIGLEDKRVKPMSAEVTLEDRYKSFPGRDHNSIKDLSSSEDDVVRHLCARLCVGDERYGEALHIA